MDGKSAGCTSCNVGVVCRSDYDEPCSHPSDWHRFGTHAVPVECAQEPLTFAGEGEDGLPVWERHDDCLVSLGYCDGCRQRDVPIAHSTEHVDFCFDCMEAAQNGSEVTP